jgi:Reverse transcriptase (RNA-dependent DNA polymerase)
VIILVYVDDIIITDTNSDSIVTIITKLQSSFPLKDLDTLHYFLDIKIQPTQTSLHLSQHKYVTDLLKKLICIIQNRAQLSWLQINLYQKLMVNLLKTLPFIAWLLEHFNMQL